MTVRAYAKINLTLDILGREGDYHLIDSLMTTVDLYDAVSVKGRKDGKVTVSMRGMRSESIPPERNNALRAGERFVAAFHTQGADISISKNIPIGAGLGGSSADAAGVLRALAALYGISDEGALLSLAAELGSDVPFLLLGGFARVTGRGERVEPLGDPPDLDLLLLVPEEEVSTAECYRLSDGYPHAKPHTERVLSCLRAGNTEWAEKLFYNDLTPAAISLSPAVGEAIKALGALSPRCVCMTGSGSGVFAVFETRELCEWAKSRYRGGCRSYVLKTAGRRTDVRKNPFSL